MNVLLRVYLTFWLNIGRGFFYQIQIFVLDDLAFKQNQHKFKVISFKRVKCFFVRKSLALELCTYIKDNFSFHLFNLLYFLCLQKTYNLRPFPLSTFYIEERFLILSDKNLTRKMRDLEKSEK